MSPDFPRAGKSDPPAAGCGRCLEIQCTDQVHFLLAYFNMLGSLSISFPTCACIERTKVVNQFHSASRRHAAPAAQHSRRWSQTRAHPARQPRSTCRTRFSSRTLPATAPSAPSPSASARCFWSPPRFCGSVAAKLHIHSIKAWSALSNAAHIRQ